MTWVFVFENEIFTGVDNAENKTTNESTIYATSLFGVNIASEACDNGDDGPASLKRSNGGLPAVHCGKYGSLGTAGITAYS